jgi:hypothetical protein
MERIVPANFPQQLAAAAFVNGEEAAWEQEHCLIAIDWFSQNGYAILGLELWLPAGGGIHTAISTKAGLELFASSCDPVKDETWENYVQRSSREAASHIASFSWPENSLEPQRPVYFNLCWADREWFRKREKKNAEHTSDK